MGELRDGGSFRDPSGFVFRQSGVLYRQVNDRYAARYDLLLKSGLYDELVGDLLLIRHDEVAIELAAAPDSYRILKPEPIPFVSYPYEWCFSQLKAAGLATLEIQRRALERGMILKDASAFNIQFIGTRAVLIDTLSFEPYEEGLPWVAYRQFCQHFLAPLSLMSKVDVRLGKLLGSFLDGVPLDLASSLLPSRSWLGLGGLLHVHLHARSIRRFSNTEAPPAARPRTVSRHGLLGLIDNLESSIRGLSWNPEGTEWSAYDREHSYDDQGMETKRESVATFLSALRPSRVWDLGANTGVFSRIAADHADHVVALDADQGAVEKHFQTLAGKSSESVLPLCMDLTDPTPPRGWMGRERKGLLERGPADVLLALALIHHLCITGNVPLEMVADGMADMGKHLVIEFVPKNDVQVQRLLRSREDVFTNYTQHRFENCFSQRFEILERRPIAASGRTLYLMSARRVEGAASDEGSAPGSPAGLRR